MILDIIPNDNPVLHQSTKRFDFNNPPLDPNELFVNLKETMISNNGFGLSAPQVGIPYQAFVIGNPKDPDSIFSVFNPTVVNNENEELGEEGCLSYPGLFIKVKRPTNIRVRFSGHDGNVDTMRMTGYTARAFMHEYDHLRGITYIDRVSRMQYDRALKQKMKLDRIRERNSL